MKRFLILSAAALLLSGCMGPGIPDEPVVNVDASMEFLAPGLRPEMLQFPDYLLMSEYELMQHGRIPDSRLVGAGLRTRLSLSVVRREFADILAEKGWNTVKMDVGPQSFRLVVERYSEEVEIRAVQGLGPTEIFILYYPGDPVPETF